MVKYFVQQVLVVLFFSQKSHMLEERAMAWHIAKLVRSNANLVVKFQGSWFSVSPIKLHVGGDSYDIFLLQACAKV